MDIILEALDVILDALDVILNGGYGGVLGDFDRADNGIFYQVVADPEHTAGDAEERETMGRWIFAFVPSLCCLAGELGIFITWGIMVQSGRAEFRCR